jgi:deoxyadenosine/deoxycytidine kinase
MAKENLKPKVVFIYGMAAVGKYTVAKELEKLTSFKVLHNHDILDLLSKFFERKSNVVYKLKLEMYKNLSKYLMQDNISCIFTQMYADDWVSMSGMSDRQFVKILAKSVTDNGGVFLPVQLVCSTKELHKRVVDPSRKKFGKSKNKKQINDWLEAFDFETPAPFKNNLTIDNTNISAKKVAKMIKDHFRL